MKKTIEIIRLARGYISFSAEGGFPDRFFASCRENGVNLWNIRNVNGTIFADVTISDYKKMPAVRKKSDMKMRMVKKNGLPFAIHRKRNRIGIIIGAAVFIILMFILSNCIWTITVEGNESIDENDILRAFHENGVEVGTYVKGLDITAVENTVSTEFPELSWISLNISGGVAKILVREGEEIPEIKKENPPSNIIAKYAGQIQTYEVYEGTAEQELNAAVDKGDLLISGILTYADGTTVLRHADGKVLAKTNRVVESVVDKKFEVSEVRDVYDVFVINFFGLEIPIYTPGALRNKGDLVSVDYEEYFIVNDAVIPVGLTERRLLRIASAKKLSDKEKACFCLDDFFRRQRSEIGDAEIKKVSLKYTESEDEVRINCSFDLLEDICLSKEILYTEEEEATK